MKKRSLRWYMRLSWGFVAAGLAVLLITAICKQGGIFMKEIPILFCWWSVWR